jgi:hypothetical protein
VVITGLHECGVGPIISLLASPILFCPCSPLFFACKSRILSIYRSNSSKLVISFLEFE